MKIFKISGARKRRSKILASTKNAKDRYKTAYNKCNQLAKNSHNPLTRFKAKKDAEYFKRKIRGA